MIQLFLSSGAGFSFGLGGMLARGGVVLALLAALSVLVVAVALDRHQTLRLPQKSSEFLLGLKPFLEFGDKGRALKYATQHPGAISRTVGAGISEWGEDREAVEEAMWRQRERELLQWESRLGWLGTIGAVAPFVGLFGTVLGIIHAFEALARDQGGGPGVVAGGIAEALFTTAAGLLVAVPAVVLYNVFQRRLKVLRVELDGACSESAGWLIRLQPGARESRP